MSVKRGTWWFLGAVFLALVVMACDLSALVGTGTPVVIVVTATPRPATQTPFVIVITATAPPATSTARPVTPAPTVTPAVKSTVAVPTLTPSSPAVLPTRPPDAAGGRFGSITIAAGVMGSNPNYVPVDPRSQFPEGTSQIFAIVPFQGALSQASWRYERYFNGELQPALSGNGWDLAGSGATWLNLWQSDGLASGVWELRLYVNEQATSSASWTIEKKKPGTPSMGVARPAEGLDGDKPMKTHRPIDHFVRGTTQVYVFFDVADMTPGLAWKWEWYLNGELLGNLSRSNVWQGDSSASNVWVRIQNENGLDSGTYELKLYVREGMVQLTTFVIDE